MTKKKENQLGTTWFGTRTRSAQAPSPPFAIVVPVASAAKDDFAVGSLPQTHRVRTLGRNGRPVRGLLHLVWEPTAWYGITSLFLAIVLGGCSTVHYSPTLGQNSIVTPLRDEQVLKGQPRFSLAHKAEYSVSMGGSESFLGTYGAVLYDQSFSIADSVSYSIGMDGGAYLVAAKDRSVPPWKFDQYSWGPSLGLQQGVAWSVDGVNCYLGTDLHYERESGPLFEARGRLIPYLEKGTWEGQDSNKSPNGSTLAGYLVFSEKMKISHSTTLTTSAGLGVGFYDWPMHTWGDYLARWSLTYSLGKNWVSLGGAMVFPSRWGLGLGWGTNL